MFNINPSDAVPIWKQIEDEVRRLITIGTLREGDVVPSVRDLARDLRVNPATVAKAYQRLSDAGVLAVKRGEGTFVSAAPRPLPKGRKQEALSTAALRYVSLAHTIGASTEEAVDEVEAAAEKIEESSRRKG